MRQERQPVCPDSRNTCEFLSRLSLTPTVCRGDREKKGKKKERKEKRMKLLCLVIVVSEIICPVSCEGVSLRQITQMFEKRYVHAGVVYRAALAYTLPVEIWDNREPGGNSIKKLNWRYG